MIPCNHSESPDHSTWNSHIIYSRDHGKSWQIGGVVPGGYTNESTVAQLRDGSLYYNLRNYYGKNRRVVSRSTDQGLTWSHPEPDSVLVSPVCQGAVLYYPAPGDQQPDWLLFSNPASTSRENLTIRLSPDGGRSWTASAVLHPGPSAYSDMTILPDGTIACLYERGEVSPYETITFARMSLSRLSDSPPGSPNPRV